MTLKSERKHHKKFEFQGREYYATDMDSPSLSELLNNPKIEDLDNKYDVILLASVKAKQLRRELAQTPFDELPKGVEFKPLTMALQDIAKGRISEEEIELLQQKTMPSLEYQVLRSMTSEDFVRKVTEEHEEEEPAVEEEVEIEASVTEGELEVPPVEGPEEDVFGEETAEVEEELTEEAAEQVFGDGDEEEQDGADLDELEEDGASE